MLLHKKSTSQPLWKRHEVPWFFFYLCEHLRLLPYRFLLRPIIEGHQQTQQIIMIVSPERMRRFFMLILFLPFSHRLDNFLSSSSTFYFDQLSVYFICCVCAREQKPWQERPVAPSKQRENFTRELKISTKKAIRSRKNKARQKKKGRRNRFSILRFSLHPSWNLLLSFIVMNMKRSQIMLCKPSTCCTRRCAI